MSSVRYGYACLNTVLREQDIFTSRTCRKATFIEKGFDYVKSLAIQNLKDLLTILKWNVQHEIFFMRMSSQMFPFASHEELGYTLEFADSLLKEIGVYAREHSIRLSQHPSQFNVLNSNNPNVVVNTIRDLAHHAEIMDRMGLPKDSVMIIHGGGLYGNKTESLKRLETEIGNLPENIRNRLVLENCEMCYTVTDLLPISEKLQVGIVVDFHHDHLNPSDFDYNKVLSVWNARGITPKVHISNTIPGTVETASLRDKRKHSDYIQYFYDKLADIIDTGISLDVMFEAKMKEQAVLRFRNA